MCSCHVNCHNQRKRNWICKPDRNENPPVSDIPFFKGHRQGRGVTLQWVANNVESFEILYSTDNDYYESLEMVSAKSQTTSGAKNGRYTLTIPDVYPGETFYKLKGTLADGSVVYSEPISVMIMKRK